MAAAARDTPQKSGDVIAGDVFGAQRQLRAHLLDSPNIRHKPARDLAAHMLLHLDDVSACWNVATQWLRSQLDCQRVDTGFGRPEDKEYFPGFAEAKTIDYDVPSFGGFAVDNRDPIMRAMWAEPDQLSLPTSNRIVVSHPGCASACQGHGPCPNLEPP